MSAASAPSVDDRDAEPRRERAIASRSPVTNRHTRGSAPDAARVCGEHLRRVERGIDADRQQAHPVPQPLVRQNLALDG